LAQAIWAQTRVGICQLSCILNALCTMSLAPGCSAMWVRDILERDARRDEMARSRFRQFDANVNGVLEWSEVCSMVADLCRFLGIEKPSPEKLKVVFDAFDKNRDEVFSEAEFLGFFQAVLKSALPQLEEIDKGVNEEITKENEENWKKAEAAAKAEVEQKKLEAEQSLIGARTFKHQNKYRENNVIDSTERTELMLKTNGTATLHDDNRSNDDRSDACFWGSDKVYEGKWREEGHGDVVVEFGDSGSMRVSIHNSTAKIARSDIKTIFKDLDNATTNDRRSAS